MTTRIIHKHHRAGRPGGRWAHLAALPVGLFLVAAIGACDGGEAGEDAPPAAPASPTGLDGGSTASPEEAALATYRGMWQAYAKAGLTADPQEPDLARYATGQALSTLTSGLTNLRKDGKVIKGEYRSAPQVVGASPSTAPTTISVQDCLDTTGFLTYKAATGALVNDIPGGNRAVRATVARDGDVWKVSSFGAQEVGTC